MAFEPGDEVRLSEFGLSRWGGVVFDQATIDRYSPVENLYTIVTNRYMHHDRLCRMLVTADEIEKVS